MTSGSDRTILNTVKREIDHSQPGITLDKLLEVLDHDPQEVITAIEELQRNKEIKEDIVLWRGGSRYSSG